MLIKGISNLREFQKVKIEVSMKDYQNRLGAYMWTEFDVIISTGDTHSTFNRFNSFLAAIRRTQHWIRTIPFLVFKYVARATCILHK